MRTFGSTRAVATGPGDANDVEIEAYFPNFDQSPDSGPFIAGLPQALSVPAGRIVRIECYVFEWVGDEVLTEGVLFPVDLVISWRDGTGRNRRTFELKEPFVEA